MGQIGFGREEEMAPSIYNEHIGKTAGYRPVDSRVIYYGVLREVNLEKGYVSFKPSIVPDIGPKLRIADDRHLIVHIVPGVLPSIMPFGALEKEVEDHNQRVDKEAEKEKKD